MLTNQINALPDDVRKYIHDLETRCDPAGDVQTIASLTEQRDALTARLAEVERQNVGLRVALNTTSTDRENQLQRDRLVAALEEQRRQMEFPGLPEAFALTMKRMIDAALRERGEGHSDAD